MTQEEYQSWISEGQGWIESALQPGTNQAELDFEQAQFCFGNAQDLHWQAYLHHQQFQQSVDSGLPSQAFRFALLSLKEYQAAFDPKGRCLMLIHFSQFLSEQGQKNRALSLLRAAVTTARDQAPERLGLALACLGEEYFTQGCHLEAIHCFDQALTTGRLEERLLPWCFKTLAEIFQGLYRLRQANSLYRKALKKSLDFDQQELATHCRSELLKLEDTLKTGFSISELGLRSRFLQA